MYVSELRLYDFRQFKSVDGKPGLEVRFHPGKILLLTASTLALVSPCVAVATMASR